MVTCTLAPRIFLVIKLADSVRTWQTWPNCGDGCVQLTYATRSCCDNDKISVDSRQQTQVQQSLKWASPHLLWRFSVFSFKHVGCTRESMLGTPLSCFKLLWATSQLTISNLLEWIQTVEAELKQVLPLPFLPLEQGSSSKDSQARKHHDQMLLIKVWSPRYNFVSRGV